MDDLDPAQFSVRKLYQNVMNNVIQGIEVTFLEANIDDKIRYELRDLWLSKMIESGVVSGIGEGTSCQVPKQGQGPGILNVVSSHPTTLVPVFMTIPAGEGRQEKKVTVLVPAKVLSTNKLEQIVKRKVIYDMLMKPGPGLSQATLQTKLNAEIQRAGFAIPKKSKYKKLAEVAESIPQCDGADAGGSGTDDDENDDMDDSDDDDRDEDYVVEVEDDVESSDEDEQEVEVDVENLNEDETKTNLDQNKKESVADNKKNTGAVSDKDQNKKRSVSERSKAQMLISMGLYPPRKDFNTNTKPGHGITKEVGPEDDEHDEDARDPKILYETENVIICQYDKITRKRSQWKFQLKDGIMKVHGKDYVFGKAKGESHFVAHNVDLGPNTFKPTTSDSDNPNPTNTKTKLTKGVTIKQERV